MCRYYELERTRITELLRRPPEAEDVEEILCGPSDLPDDDQATRSRLLAQAAVNQHELIAMIHRILSIKEQDERDKEAEQR